MSTNDPDDIRRDIDRTRANLSYDVNALADEASPRQIARRQVRKVRSSAGSLRARLFGSDDEYDDNDYYDYYDERGYPVTAGTGAPYGRPSGPRSGEDPYASAGEPSTVQRAKEGAGEVAANVRDAAAHAPQEIRRRTQGAPLALGLIAFGLGGVVAALMPASEAERRAASRVKEQAAPLVDEAKSVVQESVENVKPVAQDAAASVKDTAQSGVDTVREDARSSAETVKGQARGGDTGPRPGPGAVR
ncbi:DUF3618 domain-containing protein [Raineyella fluvialis]|uniref:DUF3618 domain-containing protein n=1 Tax=Raineyella fluvialis TaxID=2662261 RepID=A0A5Q2F6P6_9ACTN|nr:YtxH domain-containing protein [Raineyella fluvialis]QGF22489.1 DUF3618 domain-containing protein [Raineyella fluvialis]